MADRVRVRERIRLELGDRSSPFRDTFRGTGDVAQYQLSHINVSPSSVRVTKVFDVTADLTSEQFTLDSDEGYLLLPAPLEDTAVLLVEGESYGMLSDDEIDTFLHEATLQHTHDRRVTQRYRTAEGFIAYHRVPVTLENLPVIEEELVMILATVQALWALSTDAATDIDISAPDGTQVPRGQRYAQLLKQISVLTEKYDMLCQQLNVGLSRIEVSTLRRVSRSTGRLVPIFSPREYDEYGRPVRLLPEIDAADIDDSGVPSPAYVGWGGF